MKRKYHVIYIFVLLHGCTCGARGDNNYYLRKVLIREQCCQFEHPIAFQVKRKSEGSNRVANFGAKFAGV